MATADAARLLQLVGRALAANPRPYSVSLWSTATDLAVSLSARKPALTAGLHAVVGVDAEEVVVVARRQALLGSGRRNHDERQVLVDLHRRQRLPAVEVADHGEHTVAGVERLLDLCGAAHGHVAVRFVVERAHHDAIAEQPAGVVDLRRRQPHAAQDRLAAIGLEAAQRHRDIDHHIAARRAEPPPPHAANPIAANTSMMRKIVCSSWFYTA
jgi:hypothetical protein